MKFAEKALAFVGCLAVWILFSCGSSIKQQTAQNERTAAEPNLEQIAEIGKAATVQIGSLSVEGPPSLGSGFFIRHDLIVTNIHVINQRSFDGAISAVKLVNKPTWYTIEGVMASDPKRDLVILKVAKVGGEDGHVLSLGDSDMVKDGDKVIVIGNPGQNGKFLQGDVSMGWISRRTPKFLDFRARNNRKGYSGGPVLNVHGDVIGITFQGHRVGAGYAIPSNHLKALLKDMSTQAKSLEKWREEPLIRYYSAVEAANRGKLKAAIKDFDMIVHLVPNFADAYINRGEAKRQLGDFEAAIKDFDMAIRLGDDYAYVYVKRGEAKQSLGDNKAAINDFDMAIRFDSAYVQAFINRGDAKSDLGDEKGAFEDFDTVIRLKPKGIALPLAFVKRASAKSDLDDNAEAIEDCNTVIRLRPVDILLAAAYNIRGKAKSAQGNHEDSIIDYNKAIQLEPNHPELYYNRGVANAVLGLTSEAEKDFKTALKLLEQWGSVSESISGETDSLNWELRLDIRSDLKADIKEALRLLG